MQGKRTERVGHLIQMELSQIILRRVKDPRLKNVTITHVGIAPDIKSARVFFSLLGDDNARMEAKAAFEKAAGFLQREIGRALELRYTPKLTFAIDDTIDRTLEVDDVLKTLEGENSRKPEEEQS